MSLKRFPTQTAIHLLVCIIIAIAGITEIKAVTPSQIVKTEAKAKAKASRGSNVTGLELNTTPEPMLTQLNMVDLFNGIDLSGWSIKGGQMPFVVKNGILVGKCDPNVPLNSFLATNKTYTDFILTAEYKWVVPSNSGIMIRAATRPLNGKEKTKIKDHTLQRVFGLQCEIDSSPRGWTGGIYGEAMGGWKYPLSMESEHKNARAAVKNHTDWNRITIHVEGNRTKTWVNGIPCSNLWNNERPSGFIALQVHRGKQGEINWKSIRIKEISN